MSDVRFSMFGLFTEKRDTKRTSNIEKRIPKFTPKVGFLIIDPDKFYQDEKALVYLLQK